MSVKGPYVRLPLIRMPSEGIEFTDPSMTKQSFKDECDVNNIMRRFNATGVVTHVNGRRPEFGDFTSVATFQESLNTVIEAESMFAELPAAIRDRFGNDPRQLLEFVADPDNRDEAVTLGIVKAPEPEPAPQKVEVVNAPAADSSPPQPKGP